MSVKRIFWSLFLLAAAAAAFAGGGSDKPSSQPATITWWAPSWNDPRSDELAAKFMKENPNIKVEIQKTVGQGLQDKILVALQSGSGFDVADAAVTWIYAYASTGTVAPLDEFVSKSKVIDRKDFWPANWDSGLYDGKLYAIPYRSEAHAFIYNKAMYKAAGLDPAKPPVTWKDVLEYSQKLTKSGGDKPVYGMALVGGGEVQNILYTMLPYIWSNGGDIVSKDLKKCTLNQPAAVEAVKFYTDLLTTYKVAPPSTLQNDGTAMRNLFIQEVVAQFQQGQYALAPIHKDNPKIELGFGMLPVPEVGKKPAALLGGWSYVVPKASKNKEAAWKLIEFLSKPENMGYYTDTFPAASTAMNLPRFSNPELKVFGEMLPYIRQAPPLKSWIQIMTIFQKEVQAIMLGQKSAQQAMDDAAKQIDPLL